MTWSLTLFRIRGIAVRVHVTFVLILIWGAYRWGAGQGLGGALFGVAAIVLLFASVTLHELGHSFQALRYGVPVRAITLLPIGGMAQMEEIPEQPGQEFRIAIAGPLTSFAIAAVLAAVAAILGARAVISVDELLHSLGQPTWAGMLGYLTMANLLLGLFNLIPAFPMDGGRVLRALLASRMDYPRATTIAAAVGQGFALVLGVWGFTSGSFSLVLIAIFVWLGAGQESAQVQVKSVLRRVTVGQAMTRGIQALSLGDTLATAMALTLATFQSDFPVVRDGALVGFVTESDLVRALHAGSSNAPISEAMRTEFPVASPDDPIYDAQQHMGAARVRAMPVLDRAGRLVGLLTAEDVAQAYRLLSAAPAT